MFYPWVGPAFQLDEILNSRVITRNVKLISLILVKWCIQPIIKATREDADVIKGQFPCFSLKDKAASAPGSIDSLVQHDMTEFLETEGLVKVYVRRRKKGDWWLLCKRTIMCLEGQFCVFYLCVWCGSYYYSGCGFFVVCLWEDQENSLLGLKPM